MEENVTLRKKTIRWLRKYKKSIAAWAVYLAVLLWADYVMTPEFPYRCIIGCCFSYTMIFLMYATLYPSAPRLICRLILVVSLAVAVANWFIFIYKDYNTMFLPSTVKQSQSVYENMMLRLAVAKDEEERKSSLQAFTQKYEKDLRPFDVRISRNGELFYTCRMARSYQEGFYYLTFLDTETGEGKLQASDGYVPVVLDGDRYDIQICGAGGPEFWNGLLRVMTWSALGLPSGTPRSREDVDDNMWGETVFWITWILGFITFLLAGNAWNEKENAEWAGKRLTLMTADLAISNQQLRDQRDEIESQKDEIEAQAGELARSNEHLTEANRKLAIFEHTYSMIQRDVNAAGHRSAQNLQHIQSGWDRQEKAAARSKRHDIINRLRALRHAKIDDLSTQEEVALYTERLSLFQQLIQMFAEEHQEEDFSADIYDIILEPWINKIHKELGSLDQILNIESKDTTVAEILASLDAAHQAIPANMEEGKGPVRLIKQMETENMDVTHHADVILDKLDSMLFNLIGNSNEAVQAYKKRLRSTSREAARAYRPFVKLHVYEERPALEDAGAVQQAYLVMEVQDNAGGFPENILGKIYHEPVATTKQTPNHRDYGEGTSYIGFFAEAMGIRVEASNVQQEDGCMGACTRLWIPISPKLEQA